MVESTESLAALQHTEDPQAILDVLFAGWTEDYGQGRRLLLRRLQDYRTSLDSAALSRTAGVVYRTLVSLGEDFGEMRWVHLAVECRDALVYGYAY